jgi:hypothetical protein
MSVTTARIEIVFDVLDSMHISIKTSIILFLTWRKHV